MKNPLKTEGNTHTLRIARKVSYGRLFAAALVLALLARLVFLLATNPNMEWGVVWQYIGSADLISGLLTTLWLTAVSMVVGVVLGTILALMRMSSNPVVSGVSWLYIWFFRGTPLLVQIIFWFNLSLIFPTLSLEIPFGGPTLFSGDTNELITPLTAGLLALSLNEAAYMSEIVRAGILSVDRGQLEAAQTIGLSRFATVTRIVLPQAMRIIIPPTGNQLIGMLKTTSLVSVIAVSELLHSAQLIYARTYQTIPLLIAASIWYLIVSTLLSYVQGHVERHYGRGSRVETIGVVGQLRRWWKGRNPKTPAQNSRTELDPMGIGEEAK